MNIDRAENIFINNPPALRASPNTSNKTQTQRKITRN